MYNDALLSSHTTISISYKKLLIFRRQRYFRANANEFCNIQLHNSCGTALRGKIASSLSLRWFWEKATVSKANLAQIRS